MPKKAKDRKRSSCRDENEYTKAAAWAWYQHGAGAPSTLIRESDSQNKQIPASASATTKPSRFKLEANRNSTLQRVSPRPKSFNGFDKSIVGGGQMFESHEDEDVVDSSLLDYYEIVELSRHLEKNLAISVNKSAIHSEKSCFLGDVGDKKKVLQASKSAVVVKKWWTPTMCSLTDVVTPSMGEKERAKRKGKGKERFHGVRQRLQQALVLLPFNTPSHGNGNIRASKHSLESLLKRQPCDRGSP